MWSVLQNCTVQLLVSSSSKNSRFAENSQKLFKHSTGHGGVACEGCHGSTHAIWPNSDANANDNVTATELQGHQGTIVECATCHKPGTLTASLSGPHGMHPVGESIWLEKHHDFYERYSSDCKACHGKDLRGSKLSVAAKNRNYKIEDGKTKNFSKGEMIGCYSCHNGPEGD